MIGIFSKESIACTGSTLYKWVVPDQKINAYRTTVQDILQYRYVSTGSSRPGRILIVLQTYTVYAKVS
jgi:hypothetical protein